MIAGIAFKKAHRSLTYSLIAASSLTIGVHVAGATERQDIIRKAVEVCKSRSIPEAETLFSPPSWRRISEDDFTEWRQSYMQYNGGSVDVIGWQAPTSGSVSAGDAFSFWVTSGPNAGFACSYTARKSEGLLDAISAVLGVPEGLETRENATSANWRNDGIEAYYSESGNMAIVSMTQK